MRGNSHVRFLGGWGAVMRPGYPTSSGSSSGTRGCRFSIYDKVPPHRHNELFHRRCLQTLWAHRSIATRFLILMMISPCNVITPL